MRGWLAVLLSLVGLALGIATFLAGLDVLSSSLERAHCRRGNTAEQPRPPVRIGQPCP